MRKIRKLMEDLKRLVAPGSLRREASFPIGRNSRDEDPPAFKSGIWDVSAFDVSDPDSAPIWHEKDIHAETADEAKRQFIAGMVRNTGLGLDQLTIKAREQLTKIYEPTPGSDEGGDVGTNTGTGVWSVYVKSKTDPDLGAVDHASIEGAKTYEQALQKFYAIGGNDYYKKYERYFLVGAQEQDAKDASSWKSEKRREANALANRRPALTEKKPAAKDSVWTVSATDLEDGEVDEHVVRASSAEEAVQKVLKDLPQYADTEAYKVTAEKGGKLDSWLVVFSASVSAVWEAEDQVLKENPWIKKTGYTLLGPDGERLGDDGRVMVTAKVTFEEYVDAEDEDDARRVAEDRIKTDHPYIPDGGLSFDEVYRQ